MHATGLGIVLTLKVPSIAVVWMDLKEELEDLALVRTSYISTDIYYSVLVGTQAYCNQVVVVFLVECEQLNTTVFCRFLVPEDAAFEAHLLHTDH